MYIFFNFITLKTISVFPNGAVALPFMCVLGAPGRSCLANTRTLWNHFQGPFLCFLLMPKLPGSVAVVVDWRRGDSRLSFVLQPALTHSIHHPIGSKPTFHRVASAKSQRPKGNQDFRQPLRTEGMRLRVSKLWCTLSWSFSLRRSITLL